MSDILWRGRWASSAGVVVEHRPVRTVPARVARTVSVPGRNGALVYDEGRWADVEIAYEVYLTGGDVQDAISRLGAWLGEGGEGELRDTYDPAHYRIGRVSGDADIVDSFGKLGRTTLRWTCRPQRFLVVGSTPFEVANGGHVDNPTAFTAKPLVKVTGSGSGTLTIGSRSLSIASIPAGGLYIDSDMKDCYDANGTNMNNAVTLSGGWPELPGGASSIGFGGGIAGVEITPRFWEL